MQQDTRSRSGNFISDKPAEDLLNDLIANSTRTEHYKQAGLAFLKAAKKGDAEKLQRLIDQNAPVNFVDDRDHATALHYIAAYAARPALRVLLRSGKCDFLIQDRNGRLPSELAREYGDDR